MKKSKKSEDELKTWQEKLAKYQKKYDELRKQSPERWWHDEHFDIQMRVLEAFIAEAKRKINKLRRKKSKFD
jgi:uncharacterized protein HemX